MVTENIFFSSKPFFVWVRRNLHTGPPMCARCAGRTCHGHLLCEDFAVSNNVLQSVLQRHWRALLLSLLLAIVDSQGVAAENPSLAFDFARTLECQDVTAESNLEVGSGEKVIRVDLRLSVRVLSGSIGAVDEIRLEISDCDQRMRVHRFSPETRLESRLREDPQWSRTTETSHSFGGTLGGEVPVLAGNVVARVTPSIHGRMGQRKTVIESEKRIAPKQVVVVSGTTDQEHGVFFSFRPSAHSSLEGTHLVSIDFIVPETWRGDVMLVDCQAKGKQKVLWMRQEKTWASNRTPVALYLAGDRQARQAAERHIRHRDE